MLTCKELDLPRGCGQLNAMTVDVEDYFQVSAFEGTIQKSDWSNQQIRVERNVARILELFDQSKVKATFFTLAWVAKRFPQTIRDIVAAGHELASHGMDHTRVTNQTRPEFEVDSQQSKTILEDISGVPVIGYRAASYSIVRDNLWALEALKQAGYKYSSSIYPIKHDLYGVPDAPRFPFRLNDNSVVEIPVTTVRIFNRNFPSGGGGFFRLLPYPISRWALKRVNKLDSASGMFYFHPWEIDPDQPRVNGASLKSRFRHYLNLEKTEHRLTRLLNDFEWGRMDKVFGVD